MSNIQTQEEEYGSIRLTKNTIRRLDSKGQYRDTHNTIVNRLLNYVEKRESEEEY